MPVATANEERGDWAIGLLVLLKLTSQLKWHVPFRSAMASL
jgi:hypothetical protein